MRSHVTQSHVTHLLRYPIASADMYYSVVNERDVCVSDEPIYGFHIWGEIPGLGERTAVDLCEVFLEYAMGCIGAEREAARRVQLIDDFGRRLGENLAKYIRSNSAGAMRRNLGECSLECILEAMNAQFLVEQRGAELRYILEECPIRAASKRTGLPYDELAHLGIKTLCQSLIDVLDPYLQVYAPANSAAEHIFSVVKMVYA